jgi:enoyl-CoA hydratase
MWGAAMIAELGRWLARWSADPVAYAVAIETQEQGFGGGLAWEEARRALATASRDGKEIAPYAACRLQWQAESFTKPIVALIDGAVEDFSLGLIMCGTHRVATPRSTFRSTSALSGLPPDPLALWSLAQLPDRLGRWAALTSASLSAADAMSLGLVTHIADAHAFHAITAGLADADPVDPLVDGYMISGAPALTSQRRARLAHIFAAPTLSDVQARARDDGGSDLRSLETAPAAALELTWRLLLRLEGVPAKQGIENCSRCAAAMLLSGEPLTMGDTAHIEWLLAGGDEPPFTLPERRKTLPPIT